MFETIGVAEMPQGFSEITAREQRFVLELLRHGQMARAARDAGYSENSAGAIASETLRKPKVFAFYSKCLAQVASNADKLTQRVAQRSILYHDKAVAASQDIANLDALILTSRKSGSKGFESQYETQREHAVRAEKHYSELSTKTDALLASLLGKLNLNVHGVVTHNHVIVDDKFEASLVEKRRTLQARVAEQPVAAAA